MDSILKQFKTKIWANRDRRNNLLLWLSLTVWVVVLLYQIFNQEPVEPPGSLQEIMCMDCRSKQTLKIISLEETPLRCPKCKGSMAYEYKCADCQRDFPAFFTPFTTCNVNTVLKQTQGTRQGIGGPICTNCKGNNTYRVFTVIP